MYVLPDEIKHEHEVNVFCENKTCLFLLDLLVAATKGNQKTQFSFLFCIALLKLRLQCSFHIEQLGINLHFMCCLLGSNQSLRLKQCNKMRLGKSAHLDPLLALVFLCFCICFSLCIFKQDCTSTVSLRRNLSQSCWKYLICFLNHDSDSLLLKVAEGRKKRKFGTSNPFLPVERWYNGLVRLLELQNMECLGFRADNSLQQN